MYIFSNDYNFVDIHLHLIDIVSDIFLSHLIIFPFHNAEFFYIPFIFIFMVHHRLHIDSFLLWNSCEFSLNLLSLTMTLLYTMVHNWGYKGDPPWGFEFCFAIV